MQEVRLCDKDAEIERIKQYCSARGCDHKYWSIYCKACEVADMIDEFESAQEVEAEPVRHGRWHYDLPNAIFSCSECHMMYRDNPNYCPRCGARMDGGSDNDGS